MNPDPKQFDPWGGLSYRKPMLRPNSQLCPEDIKYDIQEYLRVGQPPGNFLFQVLSNNLKESLDFPWPPARSLGAYDN